MDGRKLAAIENDNHIAMLHLNKNLYIDPPHQGGPDSSKKAIYIQIEKPERTV